MKLIVRSKQVNDCDASRTRGPACSTSSPMCPARATRRASPRYSSCRRTRRRSGRARARSRPTRPSADICRIIRTARRATLREAIGRAFGLDPARIVCGAGSDELLHLLAHAYLGRRRRGDPHRRTAFSSTRSPRSAPAATPVVAPENNFTADVDAILAAVTREDQDRLPRQSEQSDRHLPVRSTR